MRCLTERGPELPAEMSWRDMGHPGQRRDVKRPGEGAVHRVSSPQHPAIAILDDARQRISAG